MVELLLGIIFISWHDLSLSSSDWVALTQVRITLCTADFSLVGSWDDCRRVKAFPSAFAAQGAGTGSLGRSDIFVLSALPEVFER